MVKRVITPCKFVDELLLLLFTMQLITHRDIFFFFQDVPQEAQLCRLKNPTSLSFPFDHHNNKITTL